jgi:hypothetical protein
MHVVLKPVIRHGSAETPTAKSVDQLSSRVVIITTLQTLLARNSHKAHRQWLKSEKRLGACDSRSKEKRARS